jgi:hypothetical protein
MGSVPGAPDWACAGCGAVLLHRVHEDQLLAVGVRCAACGAESETRARLPGEPLRQPLIVSGGGRYRTSRILDLQHFVTFTAAVAADAWKLEYGLGGSEDQSAHHVMDEATLRGMVAEVRRLLGPEYAKLRAQADRGQRATNTPQKDPHELFKLEEHALSVAAALSAGHTALDVIAVRAVSELAGVLATCRRWQNHPAWQHIAQSLATPEYPHAILTLQIAGYLVHAGNAVRLATTGLKQGRLPDMWMRARFGEDVSLEVKCPRSLRHPRSMLTPAEAADVCETYLKKAASARRGQISETGAGMLALGGYELGANLDILESAAQRVLLRQAHRKAHLVGVLVFDISSTVANVPPLGEMIRPHLAHRVVQHPGYKGQVLVDQSRRLASWP